MSDDAVAALLDHYPKIFLACHTRHVRDPGSDRVLSANQAGILDHLDEVEGTSLADLARHSGVTPSTMSIAIDRLVRQGYVTRKRDPRDGRRVALRLTPAGTAIREANSVLDADRVRAMLAHLGARELAEALQGLALLAGAAEAEMPNARLFGLERRATPVQGGAGQAEGADA